MDSWPALLFLPVIIPHCDVGGTWSTWSLSPYETGYDTCGSCWKALFIRRCISDPDCPCNGPVEFVNELNTQICPPPRESCCPGYIPGIFNGIDACVNSTTGTINSPPINETTLPNDTYCPPSGVGIWGFWSNWSNCSADCGLSGIKQRSRICISESYGCTCYKSDVGPCQTMLCDGPICDNMTTSTITTTISEKTEGTWGAWTLAPNQIGYDYCGTCWMAKYVRTCLDAPHRPCHGPSTAEADANLGVCLYPRLSCCPGKRKMIYNASFICGPFVELPPDPAPPVDNPSYCSPYGYWGSWGSWSKCTATCGSCGTWQRNRTCLSAPDCPCQNPAANIAYQTERCAQNTCPGANPCCNGFAVMLGYDQAYSYCAPSATVPNCIGNWADWLPPSSAHPNTTCSDNCGNCGTQAQRRFCFPSGCQCPGSNWRTVACGNNVCLYPRASCCEPYKKKIVDKDNFICV